MVADLAAASDDEGSRPIMIPVTCGGSGDSGTGRGDSGGATVGDTYISPFGEVSSGKTLN